jgi:hypothetical protein
MEDKEAIKPTFYQEFNTKIEEEVKEDKLNDNQQALAYITHFKGWELLKAHKESLDRFLDEMVNDAMTKGMTMQEIGERTVVKELAKLVMQKLIDKADGPRRNEDK